LTIGLFLLTLTSCGPRSGIHEDKKDDGDFCGTRTMDKPREYTDKSNGATLFKKNCAVCHATIDDQNYNGPTMKGIADRLPKPSQEYFIKYTLNNEKVFLSGDAYAAMLRGKYKDQRMTVFEGVLTEQDIIEIYKFLTKPAQAQAVP